MKSSNFRGGDMTSSIFVSSSVIPLLLLLSIHLTQEHDRSGPHEPDFTVFCTSRNFAAGVLN